MTMTGENLFTLLSSGDGPAIPGFCRPRHVHQQQQKIVRATRGVAFLATVQEGNCVRRIL